MEENKYFRQALQNFVADVAYVKSVRVLYDRGLSVEEIKKQCTFPVTTSQVEQAIAAYEKEKEHPENVSEYIQETDRFGRKSYRKVKKEESS